MSLSQYIPALKYGNKLAPSEIDGESTTNGYVIKYNSSTGLPEWAAESASPGTITLAEGSILVGNAGGVAAAVDASTDAQILVGDGTTINSVAVSGDVSIDNAGATTVAAIDLETATVTNIASTEIMIGDGAGSAVFAALSGDATMTNAGVVTVASATGTWGTPGTTTSTGAGAVAITGGIHEITTTGTGDALTLADGAEGQHLHIVYVAEGGAGDTAVLTPTNLAGGTTITFNAVGDAAHLVFTAGNWFFLGGAAIVA